MVPAHFRDQTETRVSGLICELANNVSQPSGYKETSKENRQILHWPMQAKSKDLDGSRFWAVLIGVDAYPRYPLYGCVSDAELIEKYLVEDLGVPRDRIQRLLGPMGQKTADNSISPTRANITRTLYSLIDNPDIMRGDNIIIYFAGNGTLYDVEEYYRNRVPPEVSIAPIRSIKALCPMDHGASDDTGSEILDISDREIDAIVTQISQQKGHKITLILDCGYLRPSIRYACPLGIRRSLRIVVPLSRHTIEPMLEGAHQCLAAYPQYLARRSVAAYDWRPDRSSHVVLAACQEYQYAREAEDDAGIHGVFTKALMDALRSGQSRGTTYADLISKLPMWCFQTSLVTGDHKNEPIWYQE